MLFTLVKLPESTRQSQLLSEIQKFNENPNIHGILVQLPLPSGIDERVIMDAVDYRKDVDGYKYYYLFIINR